MFRLSAKSLTGMSNGMLILEKWCVKESDGGENVLQQSQHSWGIGLSMSPSADHLYSNLWVWSTSGVVTWIRTGLSAGSPGLRMITHRLPVCICTAAGHNPRGKGDDEECALCRTTEWFHLKRRT